MTALSVHVTATTNRWKKICPKLEGFVQKAIAHAAEAAKKPPCLKGVPLEINLLLTTDARVKRMNALWRGQDKPTNVLSFPQIDIKTLKKHDLRLYPDFFPLGDIALAYETIARESRLQKKDIGAHVAHLAIHGTLHLFGYDHMIDADARIMEKLETHLMRTMGFNDPYHDINPT